MPKTGWASAIGRSALLAVVSAALTAPLALLLGSIIFYAEARLGKVAPQAGFEPNLFMRRVGLPASAIVLGMTFAVAVWRLRRSGDRKIGSSGYWESNQMAHRAATVKAGVIAALFAVPLGAMLFVPLWFLLAFVSRLVTGEVHRATFILPGIAAAAFVVWVFRMAFGYFRKGYAQSGDRDIG